VGRGVHKFPNISFVGIERRVGIFYCYDSCTEETNQKSESDLNQG